MFTKLLVSPGESRTEILTGEESFLVMKCLFGWQVVGSVFGARRMKLKKDET